MMCTLSHIGWFCMCLDICGKLEIYHFIAWAGPGPQSTKDNTVCNNNGAYSIVIINNRYQQ